MRCDYRVVATGTELEQTKPVTERIRHERHAAPGVLADPSLAVRASGLGASYRCLEVVDHEVHVYRSPVPMVVTHTRSRRERSRARGHHQQVDRRLGSEELDEVGAKATA